MDGTTFRCPFKRVIESTFCVVWGCEIACTVADSLRPVLKSGGMFSEFCFGHSDSGCRRNFGPC